MKMTDDETYEIIDEYLTYIEEKRCPYLTLEGDFCIARLSRKIYLWCKTEEYKKCGYFQGRYRTIDGR